uniref:TSC22 domain family member 2 n=1 Tax=Kryptolebias marmoratus TaxID=37003 RepID=A0A3Q2ZSD5_KRYMA
MSKMPAKKKSCFQITSVTQAQVAAVGAADDTESLDDPDESRTEDVSSEIYDVSRAEYEPACDRSSSEEALNNVGEAEVVSAPQAGQSGEGRKAGVSAPTSTVSCSSRFRVIKLDHGTGEPFRRGRWTCTEFYEKDSEASLGGRTVDSIRHPTVTQDPAADRDKASLSSSRLHSAETLPPPQQQVLHQSYPAASATHTSFSGIKPTAAPAPPTVGLPQPHLAQNVLPQVPLGHLMPSQSSGLILSVGAVGQGPAPVLSPASGAASVPSQVGDVSGPLASGVQNVPAMAVGSSVPAAVLSASSAAMPNGLPATGFGQAEGAGCGRKSEGIINAQSPVVSGRDMMKPFMPETLNLNTPTVNSLFGIHIPVDGEEDSASGANIVAIDNKIEQAMDLVKSHLMYAVREEVEVLKEQIKELFERNSVLERENAVLKSLANNEQLSQLSSQTVAAASGAAPLPQPQGPGHPQLQPHPPKPQQLQTPQADGGQQPNVTSA